VRMRLLQKMTEKIQSSKSELLLSQLKTIFVLNISVEPSAGSARISAK